MFKLLGEKEIRARVIGKDITDSSHWVSYLRPDGVLFSDEMGRKGSRIGSRSLIRCGRTPRREHRCARSKAQESLGVPPLEKSGDREHLVSGDDPRPPRP